MMPKLTSLAKNSPNNTGVLTVSVIHLAAETRNKKLNANQCFSKAPTHSFATN